MGRCPKRQRMFFCRVGHCGRLTHEAKLGLIGMCAKAAVSDEEDDPPAQYQNLLCAHKKQLPRPFTRDVETTKKHFALACVYKSLLITSTTNHLQSALSLSLSLSLSCSFGGGAFVDWTLKSSCFIERKLWVPVWVSWLLSWWVDFWSLEFFECPCLLFSFLGLLFYFILFLATEAVVLSWWDKNTVEFGFWILGSFSVFPSVCKCMFL